jgi:signal peptidase I
MNAPPRLLRAFFAWLGYSSVHWAAGRRRRALVWDALLLASLLLVFHVPVWIIVALLVGQIIDAALITPAQSRSTGGYAIAMLIAICIGVLVQVTLRAVWVEAFNIPSGSSIPSLLIGDHVFVAKSARHPTRGQLTVFRHPRNPSQDFVKRVVAVGGDTIAIRDNQLILNGQPVPRVHVDGPCEYDDFAPELDQWEKRRCEAWDETLDGHTYRVIFDPTHETSSMPALTVAPDSYFVLGDNRDNSSDSRQFGLVSQRLIKGIVRKIWWSQGHDGARWDRVDKPVQ